ncbi:hypothetical protein [Halomonas caseinilytica]|uniref:hypothetical protein n=1 Tax=Halomonas caseinilytica TaxID=438744 RepID=UPI00084891E7|nr:hypothetical protein [Halomonas caseinilytica]
MSNPSWTPGSWGVYADDEVISRDAWTESRFPVVVVPDSGTFERDYSDTIAPKWQRKANAHLISAAPAMYDCLHEFPGFDAEPEQIEAWTRRRRAAEAKARGEK